MNANILAATICQLLNTRGIGHTTAMIEGAKESHAIILAHSKDYAKELADRCGRHSSCQDAYDLHDAVAYGRLMGSQQPILIDHHALVRLLQFLLRENYDLRERYDDLMYNPHKMQNAYVKENPI